MAGPLTSAPVLSTPDSHILTEIEPTPNVPPSSELSEEQFRIRYEIDRTLREIRVRRWQRVALQFPDSMLPHSARIFQLLAQGLTSAKRPIPNNAEPSPRVESRIETLSVKQETLPSVKLTIMADTSYGSCCVDEIAAEHVDADAVIHYGRACLSPTARLPVLYVFTENELDRQAAAETFMSSFPDRTAKVIVTADIPYASHVQAIAKMLRNAGYCNAFAADIIHDPSSVVPNRTVPDELAKDPSQLNQWHLYHISEPPTALLLTLSSKVRTIQIYNPNSSGGSDKGDVQEARTAMLLRRRYALVTSMNTVSTWGVLINTLSVKNYLHVVEYVKGQIAAAGKKSYLFVVGKLNAAKVANFSEIGGWVVIGCWESSLIDSRDFFKPILTPFELELALANDESRVWTGTWRSDFEEILRNKAVAPESQRLPNTDTASEEDDETHYGTEEESEPPEFDLRTGKYVSHTRQIGRSTHIAQNGAPHVKVSASNAVTRRVNGNMITVNGVASPAAEFLAQKRTWKGLGSDFEIQYDDEEVEGGLVEQGRSGLARGYTVEESARS